MQFDLKKNIILFVKAQGSALVGTIVDFLITIVLAECLQMHYLHATMVGAFCGGVTNCIINYRYVFEDAHQKKRHVALKYFIVWVGSILLNSYGTYLLTELTHFNFLYPKLLISVIVAVLWNYQLQRFFVYRNCHMERIFQRKSPQQAYGHEDRDSSEG